MRTEEERERRRNVRGVPGVRVRIFDRERDAGILERFIRDRDIDAGRDAIFIAELNGRCAGILGVRLIPFAHTLEVEKTPTARRVAEALMHYAQGYTRASGFKEAMFIVEHSNIAMAEFITAHGAVQEDPGDIYTMSLP